MSAVALTRDLIDAVTISGGFEPGGPNTDLRRLLGATAENFGAGAAAFSGITPMGIDGGHLTEEDLDLIAEIETWAAHFRMVTLAIQRALGDPPGTAEQGSHGTLETTPAGPVDSRPGSPEATRTPAGATGRPA